MVNVDELTLNGYVFANKDDLELAKTEQKKIEYIKDHTDLNNIAIKRSIYNKALEDRFFQTPIGNEFMRSLQLDILKAGGEVNPIPLYTTFKRIDLTKKVEVKERVSLQKRKELSLQLKYRNAVVIAVILAILLLALIIISLNGTTPNAINYKQAITNQYSAWEQELSERESAVREKERELNINY